MAGAMRSPVIAFIREGVKENGGQYGVLRKLKHIFPNTYQRIKSICSPARWDWLL